MPSAADSAEVDGAPAPAPAAEQKVQPAVTFQVSSPSSGIVHTAPEHATASDAVAEAPGTSDATDGNSSSERLTSSGDKPLAAGRWKETLFKATTLNANYDAGQSSEGRPKRRSKAGSSMFHAAVAAAKASAAEAAKKANLADDIMQRDLAMVVSGPEKPGLSKRGTLKRLNSVAAMKLERQATRTGLVSTSEVGAGDGRRIMRYNTRKVLLPHHLTKQLWNSFALLAVMFELVSMPYAVAFGSGQPVAALLLVDAIFWCDLGLNFVTAYRDRTGRLVLDRKAIIRNYLSSFFALDLLALLPLWAIPGLTPHVELLKLVRARYLANMSRETQITSKFSHIYGVITQLTLFLLLLHVCCCFLQLVGRAAAVQPEVDFRLGADEYVRRVYTTFALFLGDGGIWVRENSTIVELLVALLMLILGAFLVAILFGSVALQLAHHSLSRIRFNERMRVVNESMHFYRLPSGLQERTRKRYEYAWKQYRDLQSDELLYSLSPALKRDICVYLYQDMLKQVALFAQCEPDVIAALTECLKPQFFLEKDVLCREGQAGREMFFLKCGVVTISQKSRGVLGHLDAGEYFGEMCLLSSKAFGAKAFSMDRRTCSITAHTLVDVMVLEKSDLEEVVKDYPILLTQMLEVATERLNELGEASRITSFKKAAGCAMTTALSTKRWLKRSVKRVAPASGEEEKDKKSGDGAAGGWGAGDRAAAGGGMAASAEQVATLMRMVQALQTDLSALRKEVRGA